MWKFQYKKLKFYSSIVLRGIEMNKKERKSLLSRQKFLIEARSGRFDSAGADEA
jgi:hypothetical protein